MKRFRITLSLVLAFAGGKLFAQSGPYWATDVAPIFYAKCTSCHNPAGIAPFPLITYADAANEATNIKTAVQSGEMPPWPPDTTYTRFMHERVLSQQEIQTISDWVDNGIQPGNTSQAPVPPVYNNWPQLLNPDLTLQIPTYTVNTTNDLYRCFVIPTGLTQDAYVTKVEVIPGNTSIVHHVLIVQDTSNITMSLDSADPGPGYSYSGGGFGSSTITGLAQWTPGQGLYELPDSFGIKLTAGSNIIVQVHYEGGTFGQVDSTQIRFTLSPSVPREVKFTSLLSNNNNLMNGPFIIYANATRTFWEQASVNSSMSILTVQPHMHLIGRNIVCYAVDPFGDTIPLINVPDWSFHWQGGYHFGQMVQVPAGSLVQARAFYDNTVNNPYNPNNPPQEVYAGEATTDEMMSITISYTPYQPGDENIILDSTVTVGLPEHFFDVVSTPQLYNPYPVPANGSNLHVDYFLPSSWETTIELIDANGKTVRQINTSQVQAGFTSVLISTEGLATGNYIVRLSAGAVVRTKSIIL